MAIKSVMKIGNKKLGTPSLPVTNFSSRELKELICDMQDTMKEKVVLASQHRKLIVIFE